MPHPEAVARVGDDIPTGFCAVEQEGELPRDSARSFDNTLAELGGPFRSASLFVVSPAVEERGHVALAP